MIEESETPDIGAPVEPADVLAERRARRAQEGDPAVMRRAEAAEAAVRNLETHLAALEQRLEEVGRERARIAEQLAERESDVGEVKQREYAAQQLRVEAEERGERLQRELRGEIEALSARLQETDARVRELDAELTRLRERDARLTPIVRELMEVAAGLRTGFERELAAVREELQQQVTWERETYVRELTAMGNRMEDLRFELTRTADDLRAQLAAEPPAPLLQHTTEPDSEREAAHRREMADALVAAVVRLRARVAEVKAVEDEQAAEEQVAPEPPVEEPIAEEQVAPEPSVGVSSTEGDSRAHAEESPLRAPAREEPVAVELPVEEPVVSEPPVEEPVAVEEPSIEEEESPVEEATVVEEEPPLERPAIMETPRVVTSEPVALQSRPLTVPKKRVSWLAPAIRRLAAQRDAKLAAELVIELLPAQAEIVEKPVSYEIDIHELGAFFVTLDPGQATISREAAGPVDFSLEGSVAAFSELAAGGAARRQKGLRIRKGRRGARRFLKLRRQPIALADLAAAGVDVWPGLLLLAMSEAIDPSWTTGRRFELAFEIQGQPGLTIYVRVYDGEPVHVSRTPSGHPVATIALSGHALICLLAGAPAAPEHIPLVTGDATSVDMFLQWTARAQGLSLAAA
jgi:predicted  nucleic acid-binding Zn-ribbon protein